GCAGAIAELGMGNVTTILDYSVEGEESEESFDQTCTEILRTVAYAKNNPLISFCVFKPTGLGRFDLFAKLDSGEFLTSLETTEFDRVYDRVESICKACHDAKIKVL